MTEEGGRPLRDEGGDLPDAMALAKEVEEACGRPPRYRGDFELVTEAGDRLVGQEATKKLEERGPNPILNSAVSRAEGGFRLVYERIASGRRFGESWPAPAASVVELDSELRVLCRRDYGGFIAD